MVYLELSPPVVALHLLLGGPSDPFFLSEEEVHSWSSDLLPREGEWYIVTGRYEMQVAHSPAYMSLLKDLFEKHGISKELAREFREKLPEAYSNVGKERKDLFYKPLRAIARVLRHLGYDVAHGPDPYFGIHYSGEGLGEEFKRVVENAYRELKEAGVRKVITTSPGMTKLLGHDLPRILPEYDLEVRHYHELIDERLDRLPAPKEGPKVTVHDCHVLARELPGRDIPLKLRRMLERAGLKWVEPPIYTREKVHCCGAPISMFDSVSSFKAADNRLMELLEPALAENAKVIVMSCPSCFSALYGALKRVSPEGVEMYDTTYFVYKHLWGGEP